MCAEERAVAVMDQVHSLQDSHLKSITYRLCGFYFFLFFGIGAYLPLLSLYLKSYGLSGIEIGTLLSAGPIVSILVQPFWGIISDRFQAQKKVLLVALVFSTITGCLFPLVGGNFYVLLFMYLLIMLFQSAVIPIIDAISLGHVQISKGDYGSIRMFGSIGFAVAVFVAGQISGLIGLWSTFYLFGGAMLLCILISITLPQQGVSLASNIWSGLGNLLRIPSYVVFLLAAFLIFGPINANNSYFSLFYTAIGGAVAGVGLAFLLFAGSEAPIMKIAARFTNRFGLLPMIIISGVISGVRWFYYASQPTPALVICLFLLQGLSVGLFLPAAASYIRENTPEEVQVTAQAIYAAVGNGLGTVTASYFAGVLLEHLSIFSTYQYFGWSSIIGSLLLVFLYVKQKASSK